MRRAVVIAAVLAVTLVVSGCGDAAEQPAEPAETSATPSPESTDEQAGSFEDDADEHAPEPGDDDAAGDAAGEDVEPTDADGLDTVRVYLVRDHAGTLWLEAETRVLGQPTEAVATAAMSELLTGQPRDPALVAPAGADVELLGVTLEAGILTVDVSADIADAATGAAGEEAFAQALAHTGTQFATVEAVRLHVDGQEITELWGHLDWSAPLEPDPARLAPVDLDEPGWGDELAAGTPITVSGTSVTFESTVELALVDPDGAVVEETFTTAAQPDVGERGPFSHTFETVPERAGDWTIVATEPDPSGGQGRPPHSSEVRVTVG